jgi:hypothetical protein
MGILEKGITAKGTGYSGKVWNILGQIYYPKATCDSAFAFEANTEPGGSSCRFMFIQRRTSSS